MGCPACTVCGAPCTEPCLVANGVAMGHEVESAPDHDYSPRHTAKAPTLPVLFRCPLCGGNAFRTEWAPSGELAESTGICSDPMVVTPNPAVRDLPTAPRTIHHRAGCTFTWPRRDDHLYRGPIETEKGDVS